MDEAVGIDASERLLELVYTGLDQGIETLQTSRRLMPFLIADISGERYFKRFVGRRAEEGLALARKAADGLAVGADAYAIVCDGCVTLDGRAWDAVVVEAGERGRPDGVEVAQRYRPGRLFRKLQMIGGPAYLGEVPNRLVRASPENEGARSGSRSPGTGAP